MKKKSLNAKKTTPRSILKYLENKNINKVFKSFNNSLNKEKTIIKKIGVAVSGGPDSLSLAYFAKCYALINGIEVKFFIVDHKLREESSKEAKKIRGLLKNFNINCKLLIWYGKKPKSNIQSIARNNRYNILKKACKKYKISHLLIGHHVDDLYENFFIRLTRGSGLRGLSSFGETIVDKKDKIIILRPLIDKKKEDLIYISENIFNFFLNDPSNKNLDFKRARIRKLISEFNKEGFDKKKLDLTIRNLKSANNAINYYVNKNIKRNTTFIIKKNKILINASFFEQPEEVLFRSLSIILTKVSSRYYSPRGKSILDLINRIRFEKIKKLTLGGCCVEKVNKTLLITKEK